MLDANAAEILAVFRRIPPQSPRPALRILLRDQDLNSFVGCEHGETVVLGIRYTPERVSPPDLITDYASLTFANAVAVRGSPAQGPYMLLRLEAENAELEAFASALFEGLLDLASTSWPECLEAANAAVVSFQGRRQALANLDEQVGLFGELLIIATATNPDALVSAWHQNRYSVHDFSLGQARLEVKSSVSPRRVHWISDAQVTPASGETVTLASLYVPTASSGFSVSQLALEIEGKLTSGIAEFRRKLDEVMPDSEHLEFDRAVAQASILLIPSASVPRPQVLDPRILTVKWRADLGGLPVDSSANLEPWLSFIRGN